MHRLPMHKTQISETVHAPSHNAHLDISETVRAPSLQTKIQLKPPYSKKFLYILMEWQWDLGDFFHQAEEEGEFFCTVHSF